MSNFREPKRNTQVAGNVGDISQLDRKSQENKPPESIARQKILRQELMWQESRRSSRDNERQEIKPTIEQPVLKPSTQSTSDSYPPSDQIFKRQDTGATLSTMKPVDRRKIQENPPQNIRSNQEIPRQAAELQRVKPQNFDPQKLDSQFAPQKLEHQKLVPQKVGSQNLEHQLVEHQTFEPQNVGHQKVGPQKVGPQKPEHQKLEPQKVGHPKIDPQKFEPQKVDPQKVDHQKLESQTVGHQKLGPQKLEHQKVDHQKPEPQKVDPQKADHQKLDPQKLGPQKLERQKVDHQKPEPQKIGPQKVDHQKVEPQKADPQTLRPQKLEHQKVEHQSQTVGHQKVDSQKVNPQTVNRQQVEPQKVGHHKIDSQKFDCQKAELTAKTPETKPHGYTHVQGEHKAQCNNISDQNPSRTNLPAKTTPLEYLPIETKSENEEIEPQEVQPQDDTRIKLLLDQRALDSELSLSQSSSKLPEDKTDKRGLFGSKNIQRMINRPSNQKTDSGKPGPKTKKRSIGSTFNLLKGAWAKQVKTEELSQDDVIIAVMGPTGSGKSTFVEIATDFDSGIGHNLESYTSEINIVKLSLPELADGDVVFVDTPGFDDTHKSDVEVLKMVADWLKTTYEKDILLSGILYFHRISDNRMAGTPLKNLRMFEELCGKNALHNVVLVTTMWDDVDEETGNFRENELKSKYWRSMLEQNSTTSRFMQTRESALCLIEPFVEAANVKNSLLLQQEMVDMRAKLPATSAGARVFSDMEDLVNKRQEVLKQMRNAMKQSNGDQRYLSGLQQDYQRIKTQLDSTIKEMRELKLPLGKRLTRLTRKWFSFNLKFSYRNLFVARSTQAASE